MLLPYMHSKGGTRLSWGTVCCTHRVMMMLQTDAQVPCVENVTAPPNLSGCPAQQVQNLNFRLPELCLYGGKRGCRRCVELHSCSVSAFENTGAGWIAADFLPRCADTRQDDSTHATAMETLTSSVPKRRTILEREKSQLLHPRSHPVLSRGHLFDDATV